MIAWCTALLLPLAAFGAGEAPTDAFASGARTVLQQHCIECHDGAEKKGALDLERFGDEKVARADAGVWEKVRARVLAGEMPPATKGRLSSKEVDALIGWIDRSFYRLPNGAIDPGRPTLRRLNRVEYENTIRDLLGVEFRADAAFPSDDVGYGFDNIGDVLSLSDVLLEKYLHAAERIAAQAIVVEEDARALRQRVNGAELEGSTGNAVQGTARGLYSNSTVVKRFAIARRGQYVLRVRAFGDQAGPELVKMGFVVDGKERTRVEVEAVKGASREYSAPLELDAGKPRIGVSFVNDYYKPDDPDPGQRDRNLTVEWIELEGPLDEPVLSRFQRRWLADPKAERRTVIAAIGERVWRRPLKSDEVGRLAELEPASASLAHAARTALVALLVSPNFLFRVEPDAGKRATDGVRALDDWELATRLSYFLWSSAPDEQLVRACEKGTLRKDDTLASEVERMLRDARASSLAQNFAAQWLQIRALDRSAPDPQRFPGFDDELRAAMRGETELFFDAILRERRPVSELLLADFTFLDERLAAHYGVPGVHGPQMRRVRLEPGARNGLLGQGAILTVTSNPTRTSPVKRGKWVLDVLLGAPPPPPPPGVGDLDESKHAIEAASLRERMLEHRKNPACGSCHERLDDLGFGLENFDAVGAWRERDGAFAIDSAGKWPDGRTFRGPAELREQLASDPRFVRTLTKKLLVYALGRGLSPADDPSIDAMLAPFGTRSPALAELIGAIVRSEPFTRRRVVP